MSNSLEPTGTDLVVFLSLMIVSTGLSPLFPINAQMTIHKKCIIFINMNLYDPRLQAYLQNQNSNSKSEENGEKKVKPFIPQKLSSESLKKEQSAQNVKSFVPPRIDTSANKNNIEKTSKIDKIASKASAHSQLDNATDYLKTGGLLKVPVEESEAGVDSVYRRVAKFLVLIGEDEAAKILPHLPEEQIEKIIPEIASIRTVNKDEATVIFAEFNELLQKSKNSGGVQTAKEMLEKAYGKDKAALMLKKAIRDEGQKPFVYLEKLDDERIQLLLKDENLGVKTLVLSNLTPKKAAAIIKIMPEEEKKQVVLRLAKMESVSPDIIRRVDAAMQEKVNNQSVEKSENIDGRNALAQILKKMDYNAEKDILNYLSKDDPDLGEDLRNRLFTIADVLNCDDKFIQEQLRMLSEVDIAYMIAGKPDDFRKKILENISEGRRHEVLDQEDILKPMRKVDCERITQEFFAKLRNAYDEGLLIIKDRNEDSFI